MNTTDAYNSIKKILFALPVAERHSLVGRLSMTMKTHNGSAELLEKCRQSKIADDAVLVTDSHSAYLGYAKDNGVYLEQMPSGQHSKGPFNLARVNSYHSRLSDLNHHHKVVASKYCTGYFALYYKAKTVVGTNIKFIVAVVLICCIFAFGGFEDNRIASTMSLHG